MPFATGGVVELPPTVLALVSRTASIVYRSIVLLFVTFLREASPATRVPAEKATPVLVHVIEVESFRR